VRSILGAFLFSGDDVDKKVAVLSGGERARVALAKLLIKPGNLLLMDEPTNHLDLESSESLAESLTTYDGTLLFVSHNRAFVRRLATKIWNVHDGTVEIYPGTLDEYLASARLRGQALEAVADGKAGPTKQPRSAVAARPQQVAGQQAMGTPAQSPADGGKRDRGNDRDRKRQEADERARQSKRLKPLQRKVAELEARIAELEDAQKQRSVELADPNVYGDDARRTKLLDDYQDAASKLEELGGRWELATMELEEVVAEIGS
jgi:ATP-binding cassette subfamily F protein 3